MLIIGGIMKKRTMFRKILPPLVVAALIQASVFIVAVLASGILTEMSRQSAEIVANSLNTVAAATDAELERSTPDFSMINDKVNLIINESIKRGEAGNTADFISSEALRDRVISECYPDIINLEDIADSEAIFLVLIDVPRYPDPEEEHYFPGVFLYDSTHGGSDEPALAMLRGKRELAEEYRFMPDLAWAEDFYYQPASATLEYLWSPIIAAEEHPGLPFEKYVHWSTPFFVQQTSALGSLTAVSAPIISNGYPIGVVGVCYKTSEIFDNAMNRSGGNFILAQYESPNGAAPFDSGGFDEITVTPCYSFSQSNVSYTSGKDGITLRKSRSYPDIFDSVGLYISGTPAAAAIADIGIYPNDSPYNNERWALIAAEDGEHVFSAMRNVTILIAALIIVSTLDAIVIAIFASRFFSKGIRRILSVMEHAPDGVIPATNSQIYEIDLLGSALRKTSIENRAAEETLQAERERYYIALRSSNQNFIDYDAAEDLLRVDILTGAEINKIEFPHFLDNINGLKVIYHDDIPIGVKFFRGQITEPVDVRVWSQSIPGKLLWFQAKPYYIYDDNGKLRRTICSIRDITEEKILENQRENADLRDSVTGFYRADHAVSIVRDTLANDNIITYATACLIIDNFSLLSEKFGRFFCDALVFEAASILRKRFGDSAIFLRTYPNECSVVVPEAETVNLREFITEAVKSAALGIESIVISDEDNTKISVSAGVFINDSAKNPAIARQRAEYAEAAAVMRRFDSNIVFWEEIESDYDFTERVDIYGVLESVRAPEEAQSASEGGGINAFTLNLLEKTTDIRSSVQMLLSRIGTEFGLRRVSVFMFDRAGIVLSRLWQWNEPGGEALPPFTVSVNKLVKNEFDRVMDGTEYIILDDKAAALPKFLADGIGFEEDDFGAALPLSDSGGVMGVFIAEGVADVIEDADFSVLRETVKVLSAFLSKNRSSTESKAKSEFLSKMSHEIRTPMNAIIGMSQIALSDEDISPKQRDYLWKIDYSAKYLLALINDILDMSRIESGKTHSDISEIDFKGVLETLDSIIGTQCKQKSIDFVTDIKIPSYRFISDSLKLGQIFMNLLGNAVKFTGPGGTITFTASAGGMNSSGKTPVTFTVSDTGIGIKSDRLHKIFEAFEQEDDSTARQYGGTGLGLPIANSYVSMLGGELQVMSEVGVGTTFIFTIPVEFVETGSADGNQAADTPEKDLTGLRILIAEDDELNMEIAKTLLEQNGFVIECAEDGQIAFETWKARPENYFSLILMDIRMPVMNGLEASRAIRAENRSDAATVPIVALSANAFEEDRDMSLSALMNGHIIKPIDMRILLAKIRELLG
jgi:signal transduction histidine kinase/CheY-like chemotaxis protein/GGDEF domain-containing protein/PAS domain-containing protein